jgi:hypothetical protein
LLALSVTQEAVRASSALADSPEIASMTLSEQTLADVVVGGEEEVVGCAGAVVEGPEAGGAVVGNAPEEPPQAAASAGMARARAMSRRPRR